MKNQKEEKLLKEQGEEVFKLENVSKMYASLYNEHNYVIISKL
jgi:hypothetical protein